MRCSIRLPVILSIAAAMSLSNGCARDAASANPGPIEWVKAADNRGSTNHFAQSSSGPHKVTARTDVPLSSWIQNDRAVVTFGGRKLVIEFANDRLILDDRAQAKLPAGTKEIEIRYAGGKLSVTADGVDVPRPEPNR
jgi:hypothetical protein